MEITEEPIGAWLLFNRKPIISCDRTTPKRVIYKFSHISNMYFMENRFQILASCMEENPKKSVGNNCFLCSFPLTNPSGENKSVWQEFSGRRTLN